jgi:hypothetical protein
MTENLTENGTDLENNGAIVENGTPREGGASMHNELPTTEPNTLSLRAETSRRNGRKSKGPVTLAGKAKSGQNALQHGLFASVLPGGRMPVFADRKELILASMQLVQEFGVTTMMGRTLTESLAMDMLRLRHVRSMEIAILDPGIGNDSAIEAVLQERDSSSSYRSDADNDLLMQAYTEAESHLINGRQLSVPKEVLVPMVADLWRVMNEARTSLERNQERLRDLDAEIAEAENNITPQMLESRTMTLEDIATDQEDMRANDKELFLVESEADIAAFLSGRKRISLGQQQRWTELMRHRRHCTEYRQQQVMSADSRLATHRRRHLLAAVDRLDTLQKLSEYENNIRRSISKTLTMIREVESIKGVIDVPE